ncbi:hypothetical protein [Pelagicoccus albus]|uniref:PEP-CTERM protein-sorting domain-containing protein n=1 Tax=Pelagicoccus albus TaxID=415222 RepID=A0A7X1EBP3_9BACT|nr:hypothetical protein [Pelagicoccus albus]MBC2608017.1 hypothetical protein [Pelagicoccus albus]
MRIHPLPRRATVSLFFVLSLLVAKSASAVTMELYTQVLSNSIYATPGVEDMDLDYDYYSYPLISQVGAGDFLRVEIYFSPFKMWWDSDPIPGRYEVDVFGLYDSSDNYVGGDGAISTYWREVNGRRVFDTLSGPSILDLDVNISAEDFTGTIRFLGVRHVGWGNLTVQVLGGRFAEGSLPAVPDPVGTAALLFGSLSGLVLFRRLQS